MIYDRDTFDFGKATPGVLVGQDVVDGVVNALPPVTLTGMLVQMGEPYSHELDQYGRYRATFATFQKVCAGVWQFRGYCFRGQTDEPLAQPVEAL